MTKPFVMYIKESLELWDYGDFVRARLCTINHPRLGSRYILTSIVQRLEVGGQIETLNTIYEPLDQPLQEAISDASESIDPINEK